MNPSPKPESRRGQCWLWVCLGILFVGVACIVFLPTTKNPSAIAANSTPIGEIKTNGEHWVIFRFDAPKSRAVTIQQVRAVDRDQFLPSTTPAESFPDPSRPVYERIGAGRSKLLKVRRVGGGDWKARFDLMVSLKFRDQWRARIKASWRQKSFEPWSRDYIEHGQRFVESEFVKTTETVVAEISLPTFLSLPITTEDSAESIQKGRLR